MDDWPEFDDFFLPIPVTSLEMPSLPSRSPSVSLRNLLRKLASSLLPETGKPFIKTAIAGPAFDLCIKLPQLKGGNSPRMSFEPRSTDWFPTSGSNFLIKVEANSAVKADSFRFDAAVVDSFKMKGFLVTRLKDHSAESYRKAKLHAIASGSEKVLAILGSDRLLFVSSVDRMLRVQKILERFGYSVESYLFHFEPEKVVRLEEFDCEVWRRFIEELRTLSQVVSDKSTCKMSPNR